MNGQQKKKKQWGWGFFSLISGTDKQSNELAHENSCQVCGSPPFPLPPPPPPPPNTHIYPPPRRNFSFSTAVTLKIGSRSPKSNQFFVMSNYISSNHWSISYCADKKVTPKPTPTPTGSAPKSICPNSRRWREINQGPVVQSVVRLTGSLLTYSFNVVNVIAKVFSNILTFLPQRCDFFFQQKISMYMPYFKIEVYTLR